VGSSNIDSRSLQLNEEIDMIVRDEDLAARLSEDFERDVRQARAFTLKQWGDRPVGERLKAYAGWMLRRQI
jgi:cardiolipin synthase